MFAFHQCGFSSGSGDRIPVPAETDQHVSLAILAPLRHILLFIYHHYQMDYSYYSAATDKVISALLAAGAS